MLQFSNFFAQGLRATLRLINGKNFSYSGPWVSVYPSTVVDEWYVGEFMSAEYTIAVDYGTFEKEIIKCIVVAAPGNASITIFGRSNLGKNLVELSVSVDASKVTLIADPATDIDGSTLIQGSKLIYSANYYYTLNELSV
jgi:hypothetical protein